MSSEQTKKLITMSSPHHEQPLFANAMSYDFSIVINLKAKLNIYLNSNLSAREPFLAEVIKK